MWVNHPLQVSQLGQLSLSSIRVDKLSSELFYGTCAGRAFGECSRRLTGAFDQPLCAVCGSNLAVLNLSVCCLPAWRLLCCVLLCVADVCTVLIARYVSN